MLGWVIVFGLISSAGADRPRGDTNGDFRVDYQDLALLARQWLSDPNAEDDPNGTDNVTDANDLDPTGDLNGDGRIDVKDMAVLSAHWGQTDCPIVINELLAHSHDVAPDWIELYNLSSLRVDLSGWTLSDAEDDLSKYRIPDGTAIEPNGYVVFYEDEHFGNPLDPNALSPFGLSENGEALYLHSAADSAFPDYLVSQTFGASETSVPFGRYRKSTGIYDFVFMSEPTPGAPNAYPLVGPIVINEIMYRPAGDDDAEYVELLNVSDGSVTLFDFASYEPWRFTDGSGIDFAFPSNVPVTLEPGQHLLLVRDLSEVQQAFNLPANAMILSWDSGKLSNSGERLQLLKPGDVDELGNRYWIEVDRVDYSDGAHGEDLEDGLDLWPPEADGLGFSLNRLSARRYGNDPANWQATIPTPGSAND